MKYTLLGIGAALCIAAWAMPLQAQDQSGQNAQGAQTQPILKSSDLTTAKATVQSVDHQNRTVTLKTEDGKTVTVQVGEQAKNFDQIKKGDEVTAQYYESAAIGIRKSDEAPSATEQEDVVRAAPGQQPGGVAIKTMKVTATIEKIDPATHQVTLKLPEGKTKTMKVDESVKNLDQIKEGDQVVVTYTQALAIEVNKPGQQQ